MPKERRKRFRLKEPLTVVRCPLKYLLETHSLGQDISEDGICLITPHKMEIGERLELGIYIPEEKKPITATGEVIRRNRTDDPNLPFLVGIKFIKIIPEARQRIREHIRFYLLKS